jgi:predicted HAD superfamily phosphohydrolase YqeG
MEEKITAMILMWVHTNQKKKLTRVASASSQIVLRNIASASKPTVFALLFVAVLAVRTLNFQSVGTTIISKTSSSRKDIQST